MNIETAVKLVKPFVGSLNKNPGSRPVLKTALVTEEHVIATNSHILIRIKHGEKITDSYLHHYKNYEQTANQDANSYPKTARLFPEPTLASLSGTLNTKEMFEAIEGACVAADFNSKADYESALIKNSNAPKHLKQTKEELKKSTKAKVILKEDKLEVNAWNQSFNTGSFTYTFDNPLPITEETAFQPDYLKIAFKTFKTAKEKSFDAYYYGKHRPWYLVAEDIEIIILPVRVG